MDQSYLSDRSFLMKTAVCEICSRRRTRYTHEQKKLKKKKSPFGNKSTAGTWGGGGGSWGFFRFFPFGKNSRDLSPPACGLESQRQKNAPFGSLVFGVENGRNTYSLKYNINNITTAEKYNLPSIGAFSLFFSPPPPSSSFASDCRSLSGSNHIVEVRFGT